MDLLRNPKKIEYRMTFGRVKSKGSLRAYTWNRIFACLHLESDFCVPTLGIGFFVHCAINLYEKLQEQRKNYRNYATIGLLLLVIHSLMAQNKLACQILKNILFMGYA